MLSAARVAPFGRLLDEGRSGPTVSTREGCAEGLSPEELIERLIATPFVEMQRLVE